MLSEESKLRPLIDELKKIPQTVKESLVDYAKSPLDRITSAFSRENVVNSIMPKFFARGVNKAFDFLGQKKKSSDGYSNSKPLESIPKSEFPEETEEDDEEDIDLFEELLKTMDSGFSETNQNLGQIIEVLGGSRRTNSGSSALLLGYTKQTEESTAKIIEADYEVLNVVEESKDVLTELLSTNNENIKTLKSIEKNTRVDTLKQREDEIESRKQLLLPRQIASEKSENNKAKSKFGDMVDSIVDNIVGVALGVAGFKSLAGKFGGKLLGGIKKGLGSALLGTKILGSSIGGLASNVFSKGSAIATKGLQGAVGVASRVPALLKAPSNVLGSVATFSSDLMGKVTGAVSPSLKSAGGALKGVGGALKNVGGKVLGLPLMLGMGAYEAFGVSKNDKLTSSERTVEYSKIGGKTAGALAGAKAGALIGSIGGPIGSAIGGVIGGIGGYFLGEKGGEVVGDIINAVSPSSKAKSIDSKIQNINVEKIVKPDIGNLTSGKTKANNLQNLTYQIEQTNTEKEDLKTSPTVVPVTINNQSSTTNGGNFDDSSLRRRNPVPLVRNQDGTIQRLLDLNYSPILRY